MRVDQRAKRARLALLVCRAAHLVAHLADVPGLDPAAIRGWISRVEAAGSEVDGEAFGLLPTTAEDVEDLVSEFESASGKLPRFPDGLPK